MSCDDEVDEHHDYDGDEDGAVLAVTASARVLIMFTMGCPRYLSLA